MKEYFYKPLDPQITKKTQLTGSSEDHLQLQKLAENIRALPLVECSVCRVCGGRTFSETLEAFGFRWLKCRECRHLFKSHMPSEKDMTDWLMRSDPVEIYLREDDLNYRLENIATPKVNFILQSYSGPVATWLDIGTGLGDVPYIARKKGWLADATEISPPFLRFAKKYLNLCPQPLPLEDFFEAFCRSGGKPYDIISAMGYLDLVPKPIQHLTIINRLLRPEGLVALHQPNSDSLTGMLSRLHTDGLLRTMMPGDYSYFCKESLFLALQNCGFEPVAIWWFGMDFYEMINHICQKDIKFPHSESYRFLFQHLNPLQRAIDETRKCDLMLVCARKVKEV